MFMRMVGLEVVQLVSRVSLVWKPSLTQSTNYLLFGFNYSRPTRLCDKQESVHKHCTAPNMTDCVTVWSMLHTEKQEGLVDLVM